MTATTSAERAREAAERLEAAQAVGEQLSLLAVEASPADPADLPAPAGPGRPKGSRNRRTSKMRDMLAARGMRMPEDVVAETAGLNTRVPGVVLAMQRTEQVMAWMERGGLRRVSLEAQERLFLAILREQGDAAAALLPYGLERLTPDAGAVVAPTFIMLPTAGQAGDQARVIDGRASDMAPPPMPDEVAQNQWLTDAPRAASDNAGRTE